MKTHNPGFRFIISFVLGLLISGTVGLSGLQLSAAPLADDGSSSAATRPVEDLFFSSANLGVPTILVSSLTAVHTPDGNSVGPIGVQTYVQSLRADYPNTQFVITDIQTVNSLLVIDWQGTSDGMPIIPGRTLLRFDDGMATDVWFLNMNNVSPVSGMSIQ